MGITARQNIHARRGGQLALATGVSVINFWAWALIAPLAMTYAQRMSLTGSQVSLLVATPLLTATVGRLVLGPLADRYGGRIVIAAATFASAGPVLAVGGAAATGSYPLLLAASFFLGVPGAVFAAGIPFVSEWYEPGHRGFATGVYGAGMAGAALSAYATPWLVHWFGLFTTHLIVAVALAVAAVLCIVMMQNGPYFVPNAARVLPELKVAALLRVTWEMSFLYAVVFGGFVAFSIYLPTYIDTIYHFSPTDSGSRTAGFALAAVLARPIGGILSDHIPAKYVVMASLVGIAIFAGIASLKPPPEMPAGATFVGLAIVIGIGTGGVFEWLTWRTPSQSLGAVSGIVSAIGEMGGFFPPLVMTLTYDSVNNSYAVGLLMLTATALITGAYLAVRVPAHQPAADPDRAPSGT